MSTAWGEFLDMISCLAIWNGGAEEKEKKKKTFLDIMEMK